MAYAIHTDAGWVELLPDVPFTVGEVNYPGNWIDHADEDDLAGIGAKLIAEPPSAADGKVIQVTGLADVDGGPARTFEMTDVPAPPVPVVPDGPTLRDWRVALTIWGRIDDVTARVAALKASGDPATVMTGKIASESFEYANNVFRRDLLELKDALGFTEADVDESLWRAHQVTLGDLSGVWPLP